jgi:hypothetical protein
MEEVHGVWSFLDADTAPDRRIVRYGQAKRRLHSFFISSVRFVIRRTKRGFTGFEIITLPDGTTALADAETVAFFQSGERPDPSNESLTSLWRHVAALRILEGGMSGGEPLGNRVLLDVTEVDELAELFELLTINESQNGFHCMCHGEQALELLDNDGAPLAVFGLHHGSSIRWDEWSSDGQLQNGQAVLDWLGRHGVDLTQLDL